MSRRRPYVRSMDGWWWRDPRNLRYLLREATSVLVGAYAAVLLWGLRALAAGPESWAGWLSTLRHPVALAFHGIVLVAACWHTVTWFAVAPKTLPPLYLGRRPLGQRTLVGVQYAVGVLVSAGILLAAAVP